MDQSLLGRLRSQRDLMRGSVQGGAHLVYGYLRAKDSGTAKAGTPYYIGIANNSRRPFRPHLRGGRVRRFLDVPVPTDDRLVRLFGCFATRAEAAKREQQLIARYGRKGLDRGGILLNRTLGGDTGTLGVPCPPERKARIAAKHARRVQVAAEKHGFTREQWLALSPLERQVTATRHWRRQRRKAEVVATGIDGSNLARGREAAAKYEIPIEQWLSLPAQARKNIYKRYKLGHRGVSLLLGLIPA